MDSPTLHVINTTGEESIYAVAMPDNHPLCTGMIGMHGTRTSNLASNECDLLIAVGTRFSDRVAGHTETFARNADVVHIDIDRAEINKNVVTNHHIIGDAKQVLQMLNAAMPQYTHKEWIDTVCAMRGEPLPKRTDGKLEPREIMEEIQRRTNGEAVIVTDVGQHQMWSAQHFSYRYPGQLITSGGFGTMGFGLGAAMGVKLGKPEATVIHTTGDGCFRMNCHELATVEHYEIPIITVIFNNGTLGMVRQWQTLIYGTRYSQTTLDRGPDFVKLAEAYRITGHRATNLEEFSEALDIALKNGKANVIECMIDMDEMVHPMVSAGSPITDFLLE
jgi:acetolactate synthase-1/2/3 large subunit